MLETRSAVYKMIKTEVREDRKVFSVIKFVSSNRNLMKK